MAEEPLLPRSSHSTSSSRLILIIASMSLAAAFILALYFSSTSSSLLPHPVVILISSDGFRFGYQHKTPTPNIHRLILHGTEALTGLIPVFPTLTFPNHYSIVTGLYPPHHGIINNFFFDPLTGEKFTMSTHDPKWWLGHPLWETVAAHNLTAATYFWPGSEVHKGPWACPPRYCQPYNASVPFEDRVDTVLGYFDLPAHQVPSFITLYFEDPDHQGHLVGPDDSEITNAVSRIDTIIGRLIQGLEQRGVFDEVHLIMVGDHGMVGTCDKKLIFLDDLAPWVDIPKEWVHYYTPILSIRPPSSVDAARVVEKMNQGLNSGKVENGEKLRVFLKENLPERLHYSDSDRIPPIIGLVEEGYKVEATRTGNKECGGAHGYDNAFFSMRTIFIGRGPRFARGRKIPSFENVQIYNLVTSILNIQGAPNNGSASFPNSVLLPSA
ncbi:ectonucleotide pyrophosphatase/phosphodiesterase family member 1 [Cajanus cajan]|uniref:ectonucleotide pyrophosphatase/phosphodiesterase family member 1 n=1 Tax=Cajanus cajan TaxID=3821 RepID=UPI00098DCDBA|nr:ectonucleotide pyrophosphatase/phosphodiesterase family member 1 [Cajanus cajan]